MTTTTLEHKKRALLEERKVKLITAFEDAYAQLDGTLGAIDQNKIKWQIANLEKEIEAVETELSRLPTAAPAPGRRDADFDAHLPRIDFAAAVKKVEAILDAPDQDAHAALLLVQNGAAMGGEWCLKRLRALVAERAPDARQYPVGLGPASRLDAWGVLDTLAGHLNVERGGGTAQTGDGEAALADYAERIVARLAGAARGGDIVFVEITNWEFLFGQTHLLPWFLDAFWLPLVRRLPAIGQEYGQVRFLFFVVANAALPPGCLPSERRSPDDPFDRERVLELPLSAWTHSDIQIWLSRFGLPGKPKTVVEATAQAIFAVSAGEPIKVCQALRNYCIT